jgi:short-subunit dehydrogenase
MRSGRTLFWVGVAVGGAIAARAMARQRRRIDLNGRTVLITGGSRGLGLVLARQLALAGAQLAITARDADELERARLQLAEYTPEVFASPCDVTDALEVQMLVDSVMNRFGNIDVLINCAGIIEVGPMATMTLRDYEVAMNTHYWGPLYASLAVLPRMRECHEGRIVNIASIGGKVSVPHLLPYSASKHALVGLSEGMRSELMQDGIYVTTVCPGLMRTGSHRNADFKGQNEAEFAWFSVFNGLPFTSIDVEKAAGQIVTALRYGDAELVIDLPAQLLERFYALFPAATTDLLGLVDRMLPGPGGIGIGRASGRDSQSAVSPSIVTSLSDHAATRNNEEG